MLKEAATRPVCSINAGTDLRFCRIREVIEFFNEHLEKFEIRKYTTLTRNAVKDIVKGKIRNVFLSSGKAVIK